MQEKTEGGSGVGRGESGSGGKGGEEAGREGEVDVSQCWWRCCRYVRPAQNALHISVAVCVYRSEYPVPRPPAIHCVGIGTPNKIFSNSGNALFSLSATCSYSPATHGPSPGATQGLTKGGNHSPSVGRSFS
ncbi:hypothetical protein BaRGS_00031499 [Batillaria attramentaria]|uniref:Uncharacterized protein n=1 Tax=Batillaria attramentaria TaxID=370345 RepID=A0ABD0JQX2_9CAEN